LLVEILVSFYAQGIVGVLAAERIFKAALQATGNIAKKQD
jgi:hypothetical protein